MFVLKITFVYFLSIIKSCFIAEQNKKSGRLAPTAFYGIKISLYFIFYVKNAIFFSYSLDFVLLAPYLN